MTGKSVLFGRCKGEKTLILCTSETRKRQLAS